MTVRYQAQAFVFAKEDRLEADRVFSVFTKEFGRQEIFGKSVRNIHSKLRGGIDIFSFCQIEFIQGRYHKTLTDALRLRGPGAIAKDPEKFEVASKISYILDRFIRGQEIDEHIWLFIEDVFKILETPAVNSKLLYYYFFWNFVSLLGHKPQVSKCTLCVRALNPEQIYFSGKEGGIVCSMCVERSAACWKLNADTVKIIRLMLEKDFVALSKLKVGLESKKVFKMISDNYLKYLLSTYSHEHSS